MTEEYKNDLDLLEEEHFSDEEEDFNDSESSTEEETIEECSLNDDGICLLPEKKNVSLQFDSTDHLKPIINIDNQTLPKSEKDSISKKGQNEIFLAVNHIIRKYFYGNTEEKKKIISGFYYQATHWFVMILACIVLFFVNDIIFLSAYVFVFFLDALAIVILHDCPLTRLEEKSLGYSIVDYRKQLFRSCGIRYECNHNYETQLDIIFNLVSLLIIKIGLIISYRWFIQNKNTI